MPGVAAPPGDNCTLVTALEAATAAGTAAVPSVSAITNALMSNPATAQIAALCSAAAAPPPAAASPPPAGTTPAGTPCCQGAFGSAPAAAAATCPAPPAGAIGSAVGAIASAFGSSGAGPAPCLAACQVRAQSHSRAQPACERALTRALETK